MKIFISHNWKNKTAAQLVAQSLANSAEVWLDIQQLKLGDRIQPTIDAALAQVDAVLLLWSQDSAKSPAVAAEIETTVRLKKPLLPVFLDDTTTDTQPLLKGIYGVRFNVEDCKSGLFRIQAGLLRLSLGGLDIDSAKAINDLTSFEGLYAYVQDFRNQKKIGGEDSTMWAVESMEQCNKAYQSLSELRDQVGTTLQFIQDTFARVEKAGPDPVAIQSILNEVIRHPKSATKEFKVLIQFLEGKLSSLSVQSKPAVNLRPTAPEAAQQFGQKMRKQTPAAPPDPRIQLIHNYIQSAQAALGRFTQIAAMTPAMSLKQVANELHAYLENPDDLLPDDQNGLLGLADDAWLIHNTIYRCIEAGLFGAQDIPIQWDVVVQADPLVLQILPPPVRDMLEQLLTQYMRVIGNEFAQYQPQFVPNNQFNSYDAFMGGGSAVGGSSANSPQTIDDVIYTIGDKMVYYGGR